MNHVQKDPNFIVQSECEQVRAQRAANIGKYWAIGVFIIVTIMPRQIERVAVMLGWKRISSRNGFRQYDPSGGPALATPVELLPGVWTASRHRSSRKNTTGTHWNSLLNTGYF